MSLLALLLGVFFVVIVLLDAFETVVLPRTVMRRVRLSNLVYTYSSRLYHWFGRMRPGTTRQSLLVAFAPILLLTLMTLWALLLMVGFALIHWGAGTKFHGSEHEFFGDMYFSGVTFLTLGFGDIVPTENVGRTLAVLEAGLGFGYLALVIAYVPVIYGGFSKREVRMLLLDSKAGSEPQGHEMVRRHAEAGVMPMLIPLLKDWEQFGAELLESYLSYPILAYYRSQHDDSSWLKSLTAVMDACALIEIGDFRDQPWGAELRFQARSTFAMGRHIIVDLAYILDVPPIDGKLVRLSDDQLAQIRRELAALNFPLHEGPDVDAHLEEVRKMYEPYVQGLAKELVLDLPRWCDPRPHVDNWQTSAWEGARHF